MIFKEIIKEAEAIVLADGFIKEACKGGKCKDPTPEIIDHCAAAIVKEHGYSKSKAYRICVGRYQDYHILKKHSMELTEKGKQMSKKHYGKPRAIDLKKVPE